MDDGVNLEAAFPPSLGTTKCYDCGREPTRDEINQAEEQNVMPFWEKFIIYFGQQVSVPVCPECLSAPFVGEKVNDN